MYFEKLSTERWHHDRKVDLLFGKRKFSGWNSYDHLLLDFNAEIFMRYSVWTFVFSVRTLCQTIESSANTLESQPLATLVRFLGVCVDSVDFSFELAKPVIELCVDKRHQTSPAVANSFLFVLSKIVLKDSDFLLQQSKPEYFVWSASVYVTSVYRSFYF